jgi:hypothetical protein
VALSAEVAAHCWQDLAGVVKAKTRFGEDRELRPAAVRGVYRGPMRTLGVAALSLSLVGCGIAFTTGAPSQVSSQAPPDCTTSKLAVYADGVVAAGAVGTSLFIGLAALAKGGDSNLGYATLFTFLGGVGFSISGVVGGVKVNGCRRAHRQWRAMQVPTGYPPPPYPPPGYPPGAYPPGAYPPPPPAPAPTP